VEALRRELTESAEPATAIASEQPVRIVLDNRDAGGARRRSILDLKGAGEQFAEPKADSNYDAATHDQDRGDVIKMEAIA
jgi:hypothetical protein